MKYEIIYPHNNLLKGIVEYFWFLRAESSTNKKPDIIPPENRFDLILSFESDPVFEDRNHKSQQAKGSFLMGMRRSPYVVRCKNSISYLAIRFYPHIMYQLLGFPLSEITDQVVGLNTLESGYWDRLTEKVADQNGTAKKIELLEEELLKRFLDASNQCSFLLKSVLDCIHSSKGMLGINQICDQFEVYPKRLEREFKKLVGVMPKFYSRIVRFNHVFSAFNQPQVEVNWNNLPIDVEYFDQSHFIKEFTYFTGLSPMGFQKVKDQANF